MYTIYILLNIYAEMMYKIYNILYININIYIYIYIYIYTMHKQRFSKGKILHLCIFVSHNNSILPSSGIIQIIRHFYIYCNSK